MLSPDLFTPRAPPPNVTQALDNSGRWRNEALIELEKLWKECLHQENQFTFEMLRFPIVRACGHPAHVNAYGGLAREAVRRGYIVCCGTANATNEQANGSLRRLYKWRQA